MPSFSMPDRDDVLARAVRALDLLTARAHDLQAPVAALHREPAAAHREVLAGVEPAAAVHVEVLDRAGQRPNAAPWLTSAWFGVAVWCTRILTGFWFHTGTTSRLARAPQPAQSTIGGAAVAANARPANGPRSTRRPGCEGQPAHQQSAAASHPPRHDADLDHGLHKPGNPLGCRPSRLESVGRLPWLPIGNMLMLPTGRRSGPWATSGATCATSSSTSSRSSACRTARQRPVRGRRRRRRARHPARAQRRRHRPARRVLRRRRPQPAGLRPRHPLGHAAAVAEGRLPRALGRRVVAARPAGRARRLRHARRACSGPRPS